MALAPLATVADLAARGVTLTPEEVTPVETALDVASWAVRDAAGSPVNETTSTVTLEGGADLRLRLPGLPVTAVSAVKLNGVAISDWTLRASSLWRDSGWQSGCAPSEVEATYTHGLPVVPADIVELVCRMAAQTLVAIRDGSAADALAERPMVQERVGDWSAMFGYTDPLLSHMDLPDYKRRQLAARFGGGLEVMRSR